MSTQARLQNEGKPKRCGGKAEELLLQGPLSYAFPAQKGRIALNKLSGERRAIAEAVLKISRGDFSGADKFYRSIRKSGGYFPAAASVSLIAAIGSKDVKLFDRILADIDKFPQRYGTEEAKQVVELLRTWLGLFLYSSAPCPPYIEALDLSAVPARWRRQVTFLAVKRLGRKGECLSASVLADVLLNLRSESDVLASPGDIHLLLSKALVARLEGRMDEAGRWCHAAVSLARDKGIVLPFLGLAMGPKTVIEKAFVELAPDLLAQVKRQTKPFFRNVLLFHNRYTGESVREDLTPRQVFLASSLKQGMRYKDLALRLGVTLNRLHELVQELYATLGIGRRKEIGSKVW